MNRSFDKFIDRHFGIDELDGCVTLSRKCIEWCSKRKSKHIGKSGIYHKIAFRFYLTMEYQCWICYHYYSKKLMRLVMLMENVKSELSQNTEN